MVDATRRLPGLLVAAALAAVLAAGCSSEETVLALDVSVAPNPVAGTDGGAGRHWEFEVAITNTTAVGVHVESFHTQIGGTDTGYETSLALVEESGVVGQYIGPGATLTYPASRDSGGHFSRGRERRIYHCLGSDGVYYSGEATIELH
jgi:hypothetical protein